MKFLLVLLVAPLSALALLYFIFPGRLVAFGRWLLRRRGGLVERRVTVDGRVWPYLEGGDPAKPTLLLVHGFAGDKDNWPMLARSEEHTSELQSLMRISYAVFCLKKKKKSDNKYTQHHHKTKHE